MAGNTYDLDDLLQEAKERGATEGVKRLEFVRDHSGQLTSHTAYLLLDPNAVQEEIEEAQNHRGFIQFMYILRNVLSLAPLITTWLALFFAVRSYQKDLLLRPSDNLIPFLQLWQNGFNGITGFTFVVAAGLDVGFLVAFLLSILALHELERRAHTRAVAFIGSDTWKMPVDQLLQTIDVASTSKPFIADKSDIENVIDAINKVIKEATEALNKIVTTTMEAVKQTNQQALNMHKQTMDAAEQSIKTFISGTQQSVNQAMQTSEQAVRQVSTASMQAIAISNQRVETLFTQQVEPLITVFQQDLQSLQGELHNYQGRLDELTKASQTLAGMGKSLEDASKKLEENAAFYATIGGDIKVQLISLTETENKVLTEIQAVGSGITTASGSMSKATDNMVTASQEVAQTVQQLDKGMRMAINGMRVNVEKASESLVGVSQPLQEASHRLNAAANTFASIRFIPFFRRRPTNPTQGRVQ